MTGLDKIVNQILDDAGKEASQVMEKAQAEADEILSAAREACEKLAAGNDEKIEEAQKSHIERIQSSAQLQKRQAVLKAKQELIAKVIDKAYSDTEIRWFQNLIFLIIQISWRALTASILKVPEE